MSVSQSGIESTGGAAQRAHRIGRRSWLGGAAALATAFLARPSGAAAPTPVRLGLLQFGTMQWIADVIQRRKLAARYSTAFKTSTIANTEAGRIALMAGGADVVVADWLFAAGQRAKGTKLSFVPLSSAAGGIMGRAGSPIQTLADLKDRRLGVAGGPTDKSWIIVQAASRKQGIDLASASRVNYAAPPLLEAKLLQGELDAVLTYWNFAARLEAQGAREIVSVADCERALGLSGHAALVGYVFHEEWGSANRAALDGFIAASQEAEAMLARSDEEWAAIRPLMDAPNDTLFRQLKDRFLAGIIPPGERESQEGDAARILAILNEIGGTRATQDLASLPPGLFWHAGNAA